MAAAPRAAPPRAAPPRAGLSRMIRAVAAGIAVVLLTSGCVGPMLSYQSYRDKVYQTVSA